MNLFERSALLRTLNYIRVSHGFAFCYNWLYPGISAIGILLILHYSDLSADVFSKDGIIAKLGPYFSLTAPFFLAALSAVATFSGPTGFDEKFRMVNDVTLLISEKGKMKSFDVTPRYFLSLLFGYCCVLSFILFVFSVFAPYMGSAEMAPFESLGGLIWTAVAGVYFLFAAQVSILMLLGIYYLADKFHRN